MGRKGISIWMAMMLLLGSIVVIDAKLDITLTVEATTWYVDDVPGGSPSEDFTSIQAAIDAASPGDTVYVYSGTYDENINIYKRLSLFGQNRDTTIIDGITPYIDVVSISASSVNVSGFTIMSSVETLTGISLNSVQFCQISNNNVSGDITNLYYADSILLFNSHQNTIMNNVAYLAGWASISLRSSHENEIIGNEITGRYDPIPGPTGNGIYFDSSDNNNIIDNTVHTAFAGIWLYIESNENNLVSCQL